MLLSKKISEVSSHPPEKLLLKVLQQIQEPIEPTCSPIEDEDFIGTSVGLRKLFRSLRQELNETDPQELRELHGLWMKKMTELEKVISKGGRESTQKIRKGMKILALMLTSALSALDIETDPFTKELSVLREEMMMTNESHLRGEPGAQGKLRSLLEEMKSLQTQLMIK